MDILQYITDKALIIVPALIVIGQIIKNIETIPDKFIPLILLPFGILGTLALAGWTSENVIQGILVTGVSVYGNQVWKQMQKNE